MTRGMAAIEVVGTGTPEIPAPASPERRPRPHPRVPAPADGAGIGQAAEVPPRPAPTELPEVPVVDLAVAEEFLRSFHHEYPSVGPVEPRLEAVRDEVARTGTYVHTTAELEFGARVAWRNSSRCIGRLYWRSLHLRDRRDVVKPGEVADECVAHLHEATRRGRVRSTITVFAPDGPSGPGPRIWNEQLVRYAGYRAGGKVLGDPRYVGFTDTARSLGWTPPTPMGRFDVLPLVVTGGGEHAAGGPQMVEVPREAVLEVALHHPDHAWFAEMGLRWHAVPAISNMKLDIGGITYPAAPFNGWYMATEIGARNLADTERYDLLAEVAEAMGLDTSSDRTLWRDRAAVELTVAVQHSFDQAGVSLADHHGESRRFLRHVEREEAAGRSCPVDWSWIVPPISGGLTPVFHRYYDEPTDTGPMFRMDPQAQARGRGCPM
jgi:nitric-oxide synthase